MGITMNNHLYIIGNGFDLAHGVESRYSDYFAWLDLMKYDKFKHLLCTYFPLDGNHKKGDDKMWQNYEEALGKYYLEDIYEYIVDDLVDESPDNDNRSPMREQAIYEDAPDIFFGEFWQAVREKFQEWVDHLIIETTDWKFELDTSSKYLTFNYTDTLESLYEIPSDRITHIHGKARSNSQIIVGHNNKSKRNPEYTGEFWQAKEGVRERIKAEMDKNYKDTSAIIRHHKQFFDALAEITDIEVLGFSYSDIDYPYFAEIKKHVPLSAKWIFWYYSDEDQIKAKSYAGRLGLMNFEYCKCD